MKKLHLTVTVEEGNLIFKGLSKLPFEDVYELIGNLNEQANEQLKESTEENNNQGLNSSMMQ